ncbi:hypothetical protein KFE25_011589 [Diacronema lutheri]|uniref:Uncharacterized protein n=1 Tax=Diacronema lutheri TaxID=2081491 RepID=A0A8J5XKD9_DIALT|nr:hypothetical protein KFE25_011589 [Diacronema lutheri]
MAPADAIAARYATLCTRPSDIHEHLPTLRAYAERVDSIVEMGVRGVVSTWALLSGLTSGGGGAGKLLIGVDIEPCAYEEPARAGRELGVDVRFVQGNSISVDVPERDLLFIDTWHVYGHLRRELAAHHAKTRKWIVLHDTTVDADVGESIRCRRDIAEQMRVSGYPRAEIERGLWPAVEEFLAERREWTLEKRFVNNNGLTVLAKRGAEARR